ncbi:MAG: biopolymer transporter ExbD [Pseudomonadales bacterium]|nr:biopolymer transporter ExbD [Pseudomonadales bacterium]
MKRLSKRRHSQATPELDVTPFMNLMIVLVPVLLLSMVFVHTTVIDLNFPSGEAAGEMDPANVHLEVRITDGGLVVADGRSIITTLPPRQDGTQDFEALSQTMQEIKRRMPEKRDATILLAPDTDYQTLVSVMDSVRSVRTVVNGQSVHAELFPEVSLGDAPVKGQGGLS